MITSKLFFPAVAAAVLAFSAMSVAENWTYIGEYQRTIKNTGDWKGFVCTADASYAENEQTKIYASPGDDTRTVFLQTINGLGAPVRPDAFSLNNDIPSWLEAENKALYYTTVQNFDEHGLTFTKFGFNDDINIINSNGAEFFVKHAQLNGAGDSLGSPDMVDGAGRLGRRNEFVLTDYEYEYSGTPPTTGTRIYFSAGGHATITSTAAGELPAIRTRSQATWGLGGGDYKGAAHAADVLTGVWDADGILISTGYLEKAYRIAGTMLDDKFWLAANGSLKWNTWFGYVSTSTSSNEAVAVEAPGHSVMRNFMRYIFDIDAMKVYDADGDGIFDEGDGDAIMFSLMDDKYFLYYYDWTNAWKESLGVDFTDQYFDGDTLFLYTGGTVSTIMDGGSNIFFGAPIDTAVDKWWNSTVWAGKYGDYDITAFDLTYDETVPEPGVNPIPEPATMALVGAALAGVAGALRRAMRK